MIISLSLWILFWFVCLYLASQSTPDLFDIKNPLFRVILTNRILIWFFVAIIWVFYVHPILWFRFYPALRWALIWIIISTQMAIWALVSNPGDFSIFWASLIVWWVYGMIIDLIATKFTSEGDKLLKDIKNK
jgi:hypothetical protein